MKHPVYTIIENFAKIDENFQNKIICSSDTFSINLEIFKIVIYEIYGKYNFF